MSDKIALRPTRLDQATPKTPSAVGSWIKERLASRNAAIVVVVIALFSYISVRQPNFRTIDNIQVLGVQMATLGIPAIGMTLLMVAGYVDLSIGSAFSVVAVFATMVGQEAGTVVAVVFAIGLGAAIGLLNGIVVWRITISPLIVTLAGLTFYQGIVNVATKGQGENLPDEAFMRIGGGSLLGGVPNLVLVFAVTAALAAIFLSRTTGGLNVMAIGGSKESAQTIGIPVRRITIALFAVNGAIIGVAAILTASRFGGATPSVGAGMELQIITAVILGGVSFSGGEGSVGGTVLAVVLLTVVTSGIVALNIDSYYADVVSGALLLAAVTIDQVTEEQRDRFRKMLAMRAALATDDEDA